MKRALFLLICVVLVGACTGCAQKRLLLVTQYAEGSPRVEQIVKAICAGCHDSGAVGAPKTGDAAQWAPRIALGQDALTASAIAGKGAMPPRGGGADLTDTEVKRAVAYLVNLAGAKFTEPPVEQ